MRDCRIKEGEEKYREAWRDKAAKYAAFLIVIQRMPENTAIQNARNCIARIIQIPNAEENDLVIEEIYAEHGLEEYQDNQLTPQIRVIANKIRNKFDDFLARHPFG